MADEFSAWDNVRRLADELELQVHLMGMDARDQWHELQKRLQAVERQITHTGERTADVVTQELHEVRDALRALRDRVCGPAHKQS